MTPDEVRLLDNKYALLFIRGERPIKDFKYNILKHPNIQYTLDGKEKAYMHGESNNSVASVKLENISINTKEINMEKSENENQYELLSEEDIEDYIKEEEFDEKK